MRKKPANTEKKKTGLTTEVIDVNGKSAGEIELPKEIFLAKINEKLLAQAVRVYLTNQRQGTSSTKTRGEVAGSTRKIYRQKGTGRARHGSIKAPIFVGGGIVFGPKPRDLSLGLPKKMKIGALFAALSSKFKSKDILVASGLANLKAKTSGVIKMLKNLKLEMTNSKLLVKTLLVHTGNEDKLLLACRNIQNLTLAPVNLLNPYLILTNQKILFAEEAIEKLKDLWKIPKS